jgi:chromate transporter
LFLFVTFLKMGAFMFGGGYAMIPVVRRDLCENTHLLSDEDFVDALSVIQASPGPVAINLATVCGNRIGGVEGAFWAALGAALPSYVFMLAAGMALAGLAGSVVLKAAFAGLRPAVLALIASSMWALRKSCLKGSGDIVLAVLGLISLVVLKVHPGIVVFAAAVGGLLVPHFGIGGNGGGASR